MTLPEKDQVRKWIARASVWAQSNLLVMGLTVIALVWACYALLPFGLRAVFALALVWFAAFLLNPPASLR